MKEKKKAKIFETSEEIISLYSNLAKALAKDHLEIFEESIYWYLKHYLTDDLLILVDHDIEWNRKKGIANPGVKSALLLALRKKLAFYLSKHALRIWEYKICDPKMPVEKMNQILNEINTLQNRIDEVTQEINSLA